MPCALPCLFRSSALSACSPSCASGRWEQSGYLVVEAGESRTGPRCIQVRCHTETMLVLFCNVWLVIGVVTGSRWIQVRCHTETVLVRLCKRSLMRVLFSGQERQWDERLPGGLEVWFPSQKTCHRLHHHWHCRHCYRHNSQTRRLHLLFDLLLLINAANTSFGSCSCSSCFV